MFVLSKNRNNPGPVPPHRQGSGGPSVYLQPLPARGDGRRPCLINKCINLYNDRQCQLSHIINYPSITTSNLKYN